MEMNIKNSGRSEMEQIHAFHDSLVVLLIPVAAGTLLRMATKRSFTDRRIKESQKVETVWTTSPALVLAPIIIPSLRLLYLFDEREDWMTVKVTGNQ